MLKIIYREDNPMRFDMEMKLVSWSKGLNKDEEEGEWEEEEEGEEGGRGGRGGGRGRGISHCTLAQTST